MNEALSANELKIAGITPYTSIDFPGKLSLVVFIQGCPWKCVYCHNPHMQSRAYPEGVLHSNWNILLDLLNKRKGLLDAVVFSGGEPMIDPALPDAIKTIKKLGFLIGLHTSGCYPEKLGAIIQDVDWIGLDIKAPLEENEKYNEIVDVKNTWNVSSTVKESLNIILNSGKPFECRTTAHPAYLSEENILSIAKELSGYGVKNYALQIYRKPKELDLPFDNVLSIYPQEEILVQLKDLFPNFMLRRE